MQKETTGVFLIELLGCIKEFYWMVFYAPEHKSMTVNQYTVFIHNYKYTVFIYIIIM
jgi:hypothetical protein